MRTWILTAITVATMAAVGCGKDKGGDDHQNDRSNPEPKSTAIPPDDMKPTPPAGPEDLPATPVARPDSVEPVGTADTSDPATALDTRHRDPASKVTAPKEIDLGTSDDDCVAECVRANQMRAVGADQIDRDCKAECEKQKSDE